MELLRAVCMNGNRVGCSVLTSLVLASLLTGSGCVTSYVRLEGPVSDVDAIADVNNAWKGLKGVGTRADTSGFFVCDPYAQDDLQRRKYSDIESIRVYSDPMTGVFLLGIVDPTIASSVTIDFKDTTSVTMVAGKGFHYAFFPFYLGETSLGALRKAALGLEALRLSRTNCAASQ